MKISKVESVIKPVKKLAKKVLPKVDKNGVEIGKSGLPKEMPVEKIYYITTDRDCFERIKDANQVAIDNIKG